MKLYPVFTRRLVIALEAQGFKVVHMEPNRNNPALTVYYFEETPALREAVQVLKNT
jgi:hypothetical protein